MLPEEDRSALGLLDPPFEDRPAAVDKPPFEEWRLDRPDSLAANTAGKGLAASWLRDPDALPEIYLEPGELRKLGKLNGYFDAPNELFEHDKFYQAGWLEGCADREKAMATGLMPSDRDGRPMKYWTEADCPF